jgi:RimJ/RimL family protein N-acetyltransferase
MTGNIWEGSVVRLRGVRPEDWEAFFAWDQDSDAQRYGWRVFPPRGVEEVKKWAMDESLARPMLQDDERRYVIETLDGVAVGSLNTHGCDRHHRRFEYGIAVAREHWGHGYAADAIKILCRYMFGEMGYNKVTAWVYGFNDRSKRMHEKLGMTLEGTARPAHFANGEFHDEYLFGMTAAEFFALYGR